MTAAPRQEELSGDLAAELHAARRAAVAADVQLGRLRDELELAHARIAELERSLDDLQRAQEDELRSLRAALTADSSEHRLPDTDAGLRAEVRRLRAAEAEHSHITAALTRALAMARSELAANSEPSTLRRDLATERAASALLRELLTRSLHDGQALQRELTGIRASRRYRLVRWIPTTERHRLPEPSDPTSVIAGVDASDTVAILTSGLWSSEWYLRCNPDVDAAGVEPFRHFLTQGWRERRDPGPTLSLRERRTVPGEPADAPLRELIERAHDLSDGSGHA